MCLLSPRIVIDVDKEEIQDLIDDLDHELKQNSEKFNKLKGSPIIFGQNIQFEHIKSQKFISFQFDEANIGLSDNIMSVLLPKKNYYYPYIA